MYKWEVWLEERACALSKWLMVGWAAALLVLVAVSVLLRYT